jgi:hypothetical protein
METGPPNLMGITKGRQHANEGGKHDRWVGLTGWMWGLLKGGISCPGKAAVMAGASEGPSGAPPMLGKVSRVLPPSAGFVLRRRALWRCSRSLPHIILRKRKRDTHAHMEREREREREREPCTSLHSRHGAPGEQAVCPRDVGEVVVEIRA